MYLCICSLLYTSTSTSNKYVEVEGQHIVIVKVRSVHSTQYNVQYIYTWLFYLL